MVKSQTQAASALLLPLQVAAELAVPIVGLSSAEINYATILVKSSQPVLLSSGAASSAGVQLASKSDFCFCASYFDKINDLILICFFVSDILFVFKSLHPDQRT